jgi:hypothetical protein
MPAVAKQHLGDIYPLRRCHDVEFRESPRNVVGRDIFVMHESRHVDPLDTPAEKTFPSLPGYQKV